MEFSGIIEVDERYRIKTGEDMNRDDLNDEFFGGFLFYGIVEKKKLFSNSFKKVGWCKIGGYYHKDAANSLLVFENCHSSKWGGFENILIGAHPPGTEIKEVAVKYKKHLEGRLQQYAK